MQRAFTRVVETTYCYSILAGGHHAPFAYPTDAVVVVVHEPADRFLGRALGWSARSLHDDRDHCARP
jgi:hypothetical protein